jgi:hypothetical protein
MAGRGGSGLRPCGGPAEIGQVGHARGSMASELVDM